jgi:glycosyltransferase involved in cell wall biosynthesis
MIPKAESKLTIGIPTKNRAHMLVVLLEDIKKYQADLPIVISDNSDLDDTASLVEKYSQWLNINYVRIAKNVNQAENTNSVLKNTQTKYIVLMHDDDRFTSVSIPTYLALIDYIDENQLNLFAVCVKKNNFKNEQELLEKSSKITPNALNFSEIKNNLQVFQKKEYQRDFVKRGQGGGATGMLINKHLLEVNNLYFFTDVGAKFDKLFFLTANSIGAVGSWKKETIAKYLHEGNSLFRKLTENHYLFNQKILEIYKDDNLAIRKIHKKRIERWMNDTVTQFKPVDLLSLISSSKLGFSDGTSMWIKYLYMHLIKVTKVITFFKQKNTW